MQKNEASFWSDIQTLDERLKQDPDSYCFARLSEVYLKVGLTTDALHTARKGVARHPGYLAGQRALAMACHANGLSDECQGALEQVTSAMPEDVDALKILAHIYAEKGENRAAIRAYRTLLEFRPEDLESATRLGTLQGLPENDSRGSACDDHDVTAFEANDDYGYAEEKRFDEDDIYELNESDIFYDEPSAEAPCSSEPEIQPPTSEHHDPLSTVTLAELYVQQGFYSKALDIYRSILTDDPANEQIRAKVTQLEAQDAPEKFRDEEDLTSASDEYEPEPEQFFTTAFDEEIPPSGPAVSEFVQETAPIADIFPEQPERPAEIPAFFVPLPAPVETAAPFAALQNQRADNRVTTLENWLENIRRIKACR